MNTEELAARQEAALNANTARKSKIVLLMASVTALTNTNNFLERKVNEYESSGALTKEEADLMRGELAKQTAELEKSNNLLAELQDAVLADDDVAEPVGEGNGSTGTEGSSSTGNGDTASEGNTGGSQSDAGGAGSTTSGEATDAQL